MKIAPVAEVKAKRSEFISDSKNEPVVITRNGKAVAALIHLSDEAEVERFIVANSKVFQGIVKRAEQQFERGETLEPDEFWRKLAAKNTP
jgi:PHD/YefM family antitoxin component YafN of YafNO toxin-antitoxin module